MLHRRALTIGIPALLALTLAGCGGGNEQGPAPASPTNPPKSSGSALQLTGAGATFPYPIYSKWFQTYHDAHSEVEVNYQSIGSGGGIQQLKAKTVDFGASDAPLSDTELKEMPAEVVHIPTVGGAAVLSYNLPGAPEHLKLTPEAIAGIFLGTIKKWNDPAIASANSGVTLPDTAVAVAHRSDGSGTTYIFTNYLAAVSPEWKQKVGAGKSVEWPVGLGGKGSEGVTALVKQTPGSIGYVELAYAVQNKLAYADVKNKAGEFVSPTVESITAAIEGSEPELKKDVRTPTVNATGAKAYPISGLTYILIYKDQADAKKGKAVIDLLDWALADGQKMAPDLQYAPLPQSVADIDKASLAGVTSGGQPLLSGGSAAPSASEPAGNTPASDGNKPGTK
jgi:phosphate transport system substrate-binding protein